MTDEGTVELDWPACPHCQDEPEDLRAITGRGFDWARAVCSNCGCEYQVRMNRRALIEVRMP